MSSLGYVALLVCGSCGCGYFCMRVVRYVALFVCGVFGRVALTVLWLFEYRLSEMHPINRRIYESLQIVYYFESDQNGEMEIMRRMPSIFQHIGLQSTLPNKVQKLIDGTFNIAERRFRNRNPQIKNITSTMQV